MKQIYLLVWMGLLLIAPLCLTAQRLDKFSENEGEFIAQLETYMTSSKQKALEDTYREFEKTFKSGLFANEEKLQILAVGNAMLAQRLTASPYFSEYLKALVSLKKMPNSTQHFNTWHQVVTSMLANLEGRKVKPFQQFLEFSNDFFAHGALRYSTSGTAWWALSDKYQWKYEEQAPVLEFEKMDLMAARKEDSIFVRQTAGKFYPVDMTWKGKGGKVTWERLGLGPEIYAELTDYSIDVNRSLYEAKKAKLRYPQYFGGKLIEGDLSDKISTDELTEGSYPRFESYQQILEIKDIGQGISYKGGFRLHGTTVYGFGGKENKAVITLFDSRDRLVFKGFSELFTIRRGERIVGERVAATIYSGKDSLYHPSVNLRFEIPRKEIQLSRGQRGSDRNPFFSSMHQVNIETENIQAFVDKDSIVIGKPSIAISRKGDVLFESLEYFQKSDYQRIQNIATANPLAIMKATSEDLGTNVLDASLVASRINSKFTVDNIQSLLYDLVSQGFINYDSDKQLVELKPKVFHYVYADQEKADYDVLQLHSSTPDINATLDLKDNTIKVRGVKNIEFSPKQRVAIIPNKEELVMKKNRNMDLNGRLFAGFSIFTGENFHFEYDQFQVKMDSIGFFDIYIPTGEVDKQKNPVAFAIGSRIEQLHGVLLIDAPSNKSGREDIEMFPSFQSKGKSYVFYDAAAIQQGAYLRDSFYFEIDPFNLNALDKITARDLRFKGNMYSAKIFPKFKETLVLRDDQSLGFPTKTPTQGYPAYGGKGTYIGEIDLSNKGFLGNGNLKYLGASVNSKDIIFKPQQLLASAEYFNLEEDRASQVQVPKVRGVNVKLDWRPYRDSMYIRSEEAPFAMFNANNHTLKGTLILTPGGLRADGDLDWDKATLRSKQLVFGAFSAKADTMNVSIKAADAGQLALQTANVNGYVDFDKQSGNFQANDEFLVTTLPYNKYVTSMNEFKWDMKEETINFKADPNKPGTFVSIDPDQDSLRFQGQAAFYDIKVSQLKVDGVPHVVSADAFIYPKDGKVEIEPGGPMKKLENAEIVADTTNKYHVIKEATVEIKGRREYTATGKYEYNVGDREQRIVLQNITGQPVGKGSITEKRTVTRATGQVEEKDDFYIDYKTQFQGTIHLNAESRNLKFEGFARLNADKLPYKYWFTVSSEGDKRNLAIRYNEPKSYDGDPLFTGLYLSKEQARIYPRAMMPLLFRKDRQIFPVKGVFIYDNKLDAFIFGDSSRIIRNQDIGNKFVFKNYDGTVEATGKFNLGTALKYIKVDAAGFAQTKFLPPPPEAEQKEKEEGDDGLMMLAEEEMPADSMATDSTEMPMPMPPGPAIEAAPVTAELMTGIKFIVPEALLKIMTNDIMSSSFGGNIITYLTDIDFYKKAAANIFPNDKEMKEAIDGITSGFLDIPKKYNPYTFLFSRVKMKWDIDYQSFVNTDKNVGLMSVNGELVQKMVTCFLEIKMPSNEDDRLYLYIKSPSEQFYYFGFKQGILSVTSNNPAFLEALRGLKSKELVFKMDDGETYEIQEVDAGTATQFLRRIEAVGK